LSGTGVRAERQGFERREPFAKWLMALDFWV
jgi:hypothetical protein